MQDPNQGPCCASFVVMSVELQSSEAPADNIYKGNNRWFWQAGELDWV